MKAPVLLVVALGLLLTGEGCRKPSGDPPAGPKTVTLALNWVPEPEFGGFYAAREGGAFRKHGLDVDIRGGGAGVPVLQMVATGQAEFGIAGADEILTARARDADIVPLFATYQTSPQGIMVHGSRAAKNIGDVLKEGTIAMEPGLPYAAFLKKKYGPPRATVVPHDGGVARFLTDKSFAQQCYVTSEPITARSKGADLKVMLIADEGFNPYVGVVITRRRLWNESPELVRSFVRAVREGWRTYLDDPAPMNLVMGRLNRSMAPEVFMAAAAAQKPLIEAAPLGAMSKERWETLGKQLVEIGVLTRAPPVDFLLDPGP